MAGRLTDLLLDLADGLPGVTTRRMFGHDALFVNGNIFAVEWDGRIGVRLPGEVDLDRAMALPGSSGFDPGGDGRAMRHWVLLPPLLLDDPRELRAWVERAHALQSALPPKGTKPPRAGRSSRRERG